MDRFHDGLLDRLNRLIIYIFALAGLVAGVAGTLTSLPWISRNISSILLFELSALLGYVALGFTSIGSRVDRINSRSGEVRTLDTPDSLYRSAAAALRDTLDSNHANKSVWVVSATGMPNARPSLANFDDATSDYYRALATVINRPGWTVRIIYNIESRERLEWIGDYLTGLPNAVDLEARAIVHATGEMLAPLIIGDDSLFIAQGDRRFHAVRAGIRITDPSANLFSRNYFDSLWQAPGVRIIRRATGIDELAFDAIRRELSESGSTITQSEKS